MTILDTIIAQKQIEVAKRKASVSITQLEESDLFQRESISLKENLLHSPFGIIAEFKRKSPSKGWIHENANVLEITQGYCKAGASAISILTDEPFFGGTPQDLISARPHVVCPILRKDFIVDEYQLFEAKSLGADVILLIAAALTPVQTASLAYRSKVLGLEVLLEIHSQKELVHLNEFIDIVGVNNRDLKTFEVDTQLSVKLAEFIPNSFVKISESGISSIETVKMLRACGYQGFLMGENFMKEADPAKALEQFISYL